LNSHVPLSVLTDFQNFLVLDCRFKPDIDTATARIVAELKFIARNIPIPTFSQDFITYSPRDAVASGSLDRYAESLPKPSGKAIQRGLFPVGGVKNIGDAFLEELDGFRASLAKSFKKNNPSLNGEDLTQMTQRVLDRLVFMRFLEDKLIENDSIVESLGNSGTAWEDFIAASRRLNRLYNGIIFKEHRLLDSVVQVEDRVFEDIRDSLAMRTLLMRSITSPFPILGSIYERFLGTR